MATPPRWFTHTDDGHSEKYIEHFRGMAAEGADLGGEARLIDAMAAPHSRILDAGCGPGRTGAVLHERGHVVVGVDADPALIAAAKADHPGPTWLVGDLSELDLALHGEPEPFDAVVMAGNVLVYVAEGTEPEVLARLAAHLNPDGFAVVGFHTARYDVAAFDSHVDGSPFTLEHRFATWDLRPWHDDADFAVSVLRLPRGDNDE
jgi:2-polyprenyl-3-methyl-5-hydroxy-6-metoxy-1,4-benzoquinol methylase